MKKLSLGLLAFLVVALLNVSSAFAGDGATLVFREGHVAYINNGYSTLISEYKKLNAANNYHSIVEINIESSPFFIDLSEVVIICRDRCTSLEVVDPRKSVNRKD